MISRQNKKAPEVKFYAGIFFWLALLALIFFDAPKVFLKDIAAKTVLFFAPEPGELRASRQNLALLLRIKDLERENALLKKSLGRRPARAIPAKVILGGGYFFVDSVFIDVGSEAGVKPGDLVVLDGGVLVGEIGEAMDGRSKVFLSGRMGEEAALRLGVAASPLLPARGRGGGEFVAELPAGADANVGDTARFADHPDYLVGIVDRVAVEEGSQLKKIFIKTPFSPNTLYEVNVVLRND